MRRAWIRKKDDQSSQARDPYDELDGDKVNRKVVNIGDNAGSKWIGQPGLPKGQGCSGSGLSFPQRVANKLGVPCKCDGYVCKQKEYQSHAVVELGRREN